MPSRIPQRPFCRNRLLRAFALISASLAALAQLSFSDDEPVVRYHVSQVTTTAGGLYVFAPGRWGVLGVTLTNPADQPIDVLCATYFGDQTDLQYGRRYRLPSRSRLHTWNPIRIPSDEEGLTSNQIEFHTIVAPSSGKGDVLIEDDIGNAQFESTIRITRQKPVTGLIDAFDMHDVYYPPGVTPFDVLATARVVQGLPRQITHLSERQLPPEAIGFDSLDNLMMGNKPEMIDAGSLDALRGWVADGGRLWIMLDRVGTEIPAALLGDRFACEVMDRVTLTHIHVEPTRQSPVKLDYEVEYEEPVDLLRVVVDDAEVTHLVNGWPAAFQLSYGQGDVIFTTVGAEALVRPRGPHDLRPTADDATNYVPHPILDHLAGEFLRPRDRAPLESGSVRRYAATSIGYQSLPRNVVIGLLASGCAVMICLALWLAKRRQLERLAVYGPLFGVIIAVTLGVTGHYNRRKISASEGLLQFIQAVPGTDDVRISGAGATLAATSGTATVSGSDGGWLEPDMSGMEGSVRRMIWTDLDSWSWERLPQIPGLRTASYVEGLRADGRPTATLSYDEHGVIGTLTVPDGVTPVDALIATPTGRMSVDIDDNQISATADAVLAPGQFMADGILSDEQVRRGELLAELLDSEDSTFPRTPTLLAWTQPWTSGLRISETDQPVAVGSALLAVPITFQRPPGGTKVLLPGPLLPYREFQGPDGRMPIGLYNNRRHRWTQKAQPASTWIWVQIPPELIPLTIREARLRIRVTGPVGRLEIAGFDGADTLPIETWIDPVGTLTATVTDPNLLTLNEYHQLPLRVSGGAPDNPESENAGKDGQLSYWLIEALEIEVVADVAPLEPLASVE